MLILRRALALFLPALIGLAFPYAAAAEPLDYDRGDPYRVVGVGFAAVSQDDRIPYPVRQLEAMRAAKVDAFRALLEQVGGVTVSSASGSAALGAPLSDTVNTSAQGTLVGVEFIRIEPTEKGIYKAVAVLRLPTSR